jgi:amino acid permease
MTALPRAFEQLGIGVGGASLIAMAFLTYLSTDVLIRCAAPRSLDAL